MFFGAIVLALALAHQSRATLVQGFEGNPTIDSTGDASIKSTYQGVAAPQGSNQFLITTINEAGADGSDGYSHQSSSDAVINSALQTFAGLSLSGTEGSAFKLSITVPVGLDTISFQYDFLTNELPSGGGVIQHKDFAFYALFNGATLVSSSLSLATPDSINFNDAARQLATGPVATNPFSFDSGYATFNKSGLAPGSYTLVLGVEDKTNSDTPSGLLVDNVSVVPEPTALVLAIAGAGLLVGVKRIRRRA
jgi:hypothetical protein